MKVSFSILHVFVCMSGTLSHTMVLTLCSRSVTWLITVAYPSYHRARGDVHPIWTKFLQLFTCLVYFRCCFCITSVIILIDLLVFSIKKKNLIWNFPSSGQIHDLHILHQHAASCGCWNTVAMELFFQSVLTDNISKEQILDDNALSSQLWNK